MKYKEFVHAWELFLAAMKARRPNNQAQNFEPQEAWWDAVNENCWRDLPVHRSDCNEYRTLVFWMTIVYDNPWKVLDNGELNSSTPSTPLRAVSAVISPSDFGESSGLLTIDTYLPAVMMTRLESEVPRIIRAMKPFEKLSRRESQVLLLLCQGFMEARIAEEVSVSVGTAQRDLSSILRKLGARDRTAAVARAYSSGWVARQA